jgi:hypothetical protein
MLKKFVQGLVFGLGFGIALLLVAAVGFGFVIPRAMDAAMTRTKEPVFEHPAEARVAEPDRSAAQQPPKDFSFFKHSKERMQIPPAGGILAMTPLGSPAGSKRPRTYQLWLTETALWQVRTEERKAEIERLPRPENASVRDLDRLMREKVGSMSGQSTMTVSSDQISSIKSGGDTSREPSLNGQLSMTVEGVVFVLPNPYGQ